MGKYRLLYYSFLNKERGQEEMRERRLRTGPTSRNLQLARGRRLQKANASRRIRAAAGTPQLRRQPGSQEQE